MRGGHNQRYLVTDQTKEIIRRAYRRLDAGEHGVLQATAEALRMPVYRVCALGRKWGFAKKRAKFTDEIAEQKWKKFAVGAH